MKNRKAKQETEYDRSLWGVFCPCSGKQINRSFLSNQLSLELISAGVILNLSGNLIGGGQSFEDKIAVMLDRMKNDIFLFQLQHTRGLYVVHKRQ